MCFDSIGNYSATLVLWGNAFTGWLAVRQTHPFSITGPPGTDLFSASKWCFVRIELVLGPTWFFSCLKLLQHPLQVQFGVGVAVKGLVPAGGGGVGCDVCQRGFGGLLQVSLGLWLSTHSVAVLPKWQVAVLCNHINSSPTSTSCCQLQTQFPVSGVWFFPPARLQYASVQLCFLRRAQ